MTPSARLLPVFLVAALPGLLRGAEPPSYGKQIRPFLARYCVECHGRDLPDGGLRLDTYKGLMAGGDHGAVLVPGQPDESRIVRMVEKTTKPVMPPKRSKQPPAAEVALLRAWVAAGAKDDGAGGPGATVLIPDVKPRQQLPPPVGALAYHPEGRLLAAGVREDIWLIDATTGEAVGKRGGHAGSISALAFSPDGRRLAAAGGNLVGGGVLRLYSVEGGRVSPAPVRQIDAHADQIFDVAFSPDGKLLASCGYDRLIRLWSTETGAAVRDLKDHSDTVYGICFSPDGKLLASGAADRAVKVWEVASGKRLYTLGEATDWVYAVAWSPDGKHLAGAGVDRSIRVWRVAADEGQVVQSVFAHEGAVQRLCYGPDGNTLTSVGEDRVVKVWDTRSMRERHVHAAQPETVLALAARPDQKQIALGRYDGALVLLDAASGKPAAQPLPATPKAPALRGLAPRAIPRGKPATVTLQGGSLFGPVEVRTTIPGAKVEVKASTETEVRAELTLPANAAAGEYEVRLQNAAGQSAPARVTVDLFAAVEEGTGATSMGTAQPVTLPVTLAGSIDRDGDVDYYRFEARAGEEVGVQAFLPAPAAPGGKKPPALAPVLQVLDPRGGVVAESDAGVLACTCAQAGPHVLTIRDREYRGGPTMLYRLHVGTVPVVSGVFPLGVQRGRETAVRLRGAHLGKERAVPVKVGETTAVGSKVAVPVTTPLGAPLGKREVVVGEYPEVIAPGDGWKVPVPGTANGVIDQPGKGDTWRFRARKGEKLVLEVEARRLGSPLDSYLEVLDAKGGPVPQAVLRSLSSTYTTFRDHDSRKPGIRIESWSELAINDYLLVGTELVRIKALPRNPDDDCQLHSERGRRVGFLGTTPTFHPPGEPMYKVSIHPPGTTFPPNGLPVVTLYYRNDDDVFLGEDSSILFEPPADGEYQVRIGDSRDQGGPGHAYRLTVRPASPGFTVSLSPGSPAVSKGGALPITVTAERRDGYEGPIRVCLEQLPPGFSAPATTIPVGDNTTSFALFAAADARVPAGAAPLKLVASARIDGKTLTRTVEGGTPRLVEPGDIVTTTTQDAVRIRPGGKVAVKVKVERRNGFTGRIPLEVKGLPPGVRVLDIGLNGILVTEKETERTFVLHAEPWVEPTEHPFVVYARSEGKNTEHAARSVLLRVEK